MQAWKAQPLSGARSIIRDMQHDSVYSVRMDPNRMDEDYGRFAWVFDPEGNKIELWEPK